MAPCGEEDYLRRQLCPYHICNEEDLGLFLLCKGKHFICLHLLAGRRVKVKNNPVTLELSVSVCLFVLWEKCANTVKSRSGETNVLSAT